MLIGNLSSRLPPALLPRLANKSILLYFSNVQVTLQILGALIEKSPKDLPLFASSVLKILDEILRSNDITMVESSLPTFDAFCHNHDASSLFADQAYLRQYEHVVSQYATLASTREQEGKNKPTKLVAARWRNAGLEAIKSIASADALSSIAGRQIDVVVPMILENLWTDNDGFLDVLLSRANMEEKVSFEHPLKRRNSAATTRTNEAEEDPNPIALVGTAVDVEQMEEEDTGVLAIQCLKQIFVVSNRSQIHSATTALLRFIDERVRQDETVVRTSNGVDRGWAIKLFGLIARWAPMQERYVILVTAMDTMIRMPFKDETLGHHIVLVAMIGSLLRSDVNLIGLSIMDVLLGLIQQMKKLVHMPGDPTGGNSKEMPTPTSQRKELLGRIQQTMGDLATHVYYNEQIIDMVSALLLRLKPTKNTSTANSSPQGEQTDTDAKSDENQLDAMFALAVAKLTALKAVKLILKVANPKVKMSGNISLSRYPVPVEKWEGTHWLLRDPSGEVRKAYVDALLTWLDRETNRKDSIAREDLPTALTGRLEAASSPIDIRRARSAASYREKPSRRPKSMFLLMLHIAIYDNALQYMDYDSDIVLLHALLTKLVMRLGINAVRFGLPMVFRLQEDIQDAETPAQKVRLGSLCHGYFWVLTEKFDFDASIVGRAIQNEIIRRRTKHLWVDGVSVPAPPLDNVGTPGIATKLPKISAEEAESEALLPFDDRLSLVECICTAYQDSSLSPPGSPAASPGRSFNQPILATSLSSSPTGPGSSGIAEVPPTFREALIGDWSRESAMTAIQAASKSASLSGSRPTNGTARGRLGVNGAYANGNSRYANESPSQGDDARPRSQPAPDGARSLAPFGAKTRKTSVRSRISAHPDGISDAAGSVTSVSHLKMVLSGEAEAPPLTAGVRDASSSDDSMVSYDPSTSEMSFNPPVPTTPHSQAQVDGSPLRARSMSRERKGSDGASLGPLNSNPPSESGVALPEEDIEYVPPVPPLPSGIARSSPPPAPPSIATRDYASSPVSHNPPSPAIRQARQRSVKSRGGDTIRSSTWGSIRSTDEPLPTMDLQSLLHGIDARAGEGALGNLTRPPY